MAETKTNRIEIQLPNGYKLVAEQNSDPQFDKEMFIGVVDANNVWVQDLAVIRNSYICSGDRIEWKPEQFDVLVYGDKDNEDFTNGFTVGLYRETE